jgi:AmmeMemoRadiSam system protein B
MSKAASTRFPKLRAIDARAVVHQGQRFVLLRDPLQLSDKTLLVPQLLASALTLCDGTREDAKALSIALEIRFGLRIEPSFIDEFLVALDEALLLDNDRFAQAKARALAEYRSSPFRPPALAGQSYPADACELRRLLGSYVALVADISSLPMLSKGRGLVSPHIDYARGGPVYARVWERAREMVTEAELVVLLGTNHYGGDSLITLTRQNYATPFGVLPTAREAVESIAEAIGEETAFAGELNHRGEHSIELAAVWLHYIRDGKPVELLPILCGSFHSFTCGDADPDSDPIIAGFLQSLKKNIEGRKVIVVAAGDLSHVGPAFGGQPIDLGGRARLKEDDDELIDRICAGDARGFLAAIKRVEDRNNVCGVSPIYLALRLLNQAQGEPVAYDRCPADESNTSLVSVCGVVLW